MKFSLKLANLNVYADLYCQVIKKNAGLIQMSLDSMLLLPSESHPAEKGEDS